MNDIDATPNSGVPPRVTLRRSCTEIVVRQEAVQASFSWAANLLERTQSFPFCYTVGGCDA